MFCAQKKKSAQDKLRIDREIEKQQNPCPPRFPVLFPPFSLPAPIFSLHVRFLFVSYTSSFLLPPPSPPLSPPALFPHLPSPFSKTPVSHTKHIPPSPSSLSSLLQGGPSSLFPRRERGWVFVGKRCGWGFGKGGGGGKSGEERKGEQGKRNRGKKISGGKGRKSACWEGKKK